MPKPVGKNLLVKIVYLPDDRKEEAAEAVVIDKGWRVDNQISVGDVVEFAANDGYSYQLGETRYLEEERVLGVADDQPPGIEDLLEEVNAELAYQAERWPEDGDDKYGEGEWIGLLADYATGTGRAHKHAADFRTRMLKTAALAIAAMRSHDRKGAKQ